MKTLNLPLHAIVIGCLAISAGIFAWQLKVNINLKQALREGQEQFKNEERASKQVEALEKRADDLRQKESLLLKRVPYGEKEPLSLIKSLVRLGHETELRISVFKMKDKSGESEEEKEAQASQGALQPLYLEMEAEATFPQLESFLDKLLHLERLVSIENMTVKREKKILPYQKIALTLITYTFTEQ